MLKLTKAVLAGGALLVTFGGLNMALAAQRGGFHGATAHASVGAPKVGGPVAGSPVLRGLPAAATHAVIAPAVHIQPATHFAHVTPGHRTHIGANSYIVAAAPPVARRPAHVNATNRHFVTRFTQHRTHFVHGYARYPYYSAALGVGTIGGTYLTSYTAYNPCTRLLQKFNDSRSIKWRKRYEKCVRGDYAQLDYL